MVIVEPVLFVAAVLCSLQAGFLFAFAVIVMPGLQKLSDQEFIRSFQVMDGIIQKNQPLFMIVWLGSAFTVIAASALSLVYWGGIERLVLLLTAAGQIFGIQLPTILINIPLNNALQAVDVRASSEADNRRSREVFETRWNRWNVARTCLSCVLAMTLMGLLWKL